MRRVLGIVMLVSISSLLPGCGHNDPASVTRDFLEASSRKNNAGSDIYLTKLARENVHSSKDNNVHVNVTEKDPVTGADRKWDNYAVGDPVIKDDLATVPVTNKSGAKPETIKFKLRREEGAWRIYAFAIPIDQTGTEITLDLEHPERIAGELLKVLPQALGEGLKKLGEGIVKAGSDLSKDNQRQTPTP